MKIGVINSRRILGYCMATRSPLYIIGICGLAGVLVDIDHIVKIIPQINYIQARIWHAPLFIISCLAICYMGSCVRGLYFKLVLIIVAIITVLVLVYSPYVIWGWTK